MRLRDAKGEITKRIIRVRFLSEILFDSQLTVVKPAAASNRKRFLCRGYTVLPTALHILRRTGHDGPASKLWIHKHSLYPKVKRYTPRKLPLRL